MITGFNTDIDFGGVTYHVQTEDKGLSKPVILTLVYDRGTILASKRRPYDDLLTGTFDERLLTERLQKQHRLICAAVQAGRINELKDMTSRESSKTKAKATAGAAAFSAADGSRPIPTPFTSYSAVETAVLDAPIPRPGKTDPHQRAAGIYISELMIDEVSVIEDSLILPADAVAIINETPPPIGWQRSNTLSIELLGDHSFKGGDNCTVGFMVCRSSGRKVVGDAQIMVKVLGSSFRPVIYHARTDTNGIARVDVHLPNFNSGRAVFLVRAISGGEEIELRRPIAHG